MAAMISAKSRPKPSRLKDSDSPSDGAHAISTIRPPAGGNANNSRDNITASRAGHNATIRAAAGRRLTAAPAINATGKVARTKNAITS
jgi:hypothetical protein